ncbi:ABC transporter substrate-binding protein [Methylobacterium isbiliense]|uniref:ABC transporter substrate-binding protein n=1 Tax=Methylobacterium isbiliense TaxID=315478 RepID=UPI001EE08C95|nr:ABC transporter substrate-binding protein [Methylobacterium isbiliense]MDN3625523.1 ABC transporter substrate-binding protein [Methylobacterium isbiliense]
MNGVRTTLLTVLSAAALAAAWHGPASAQQAAAPTRSDQAISDRVVKIGFILDMSGIYADVTGPGSAAAARMAVEDFGGSVLGAPIEVLVADHQNKADVAAATARAWFDTEKVDAILDVAASATALAAADIARAKNRIIAFSGPGAVRLTNEACSPVSIHWAYDTYALSNVTAQATVKAGGDSWFFITADYAFGHELERDATAVVKASGGSLKGSVRAPINTPDFSSFLLQAQGSGAKIVGLANAGRDTTNAIKQAAEFGLTQSGQKLAGLLVYINDVHSLGLGPTQGMLLTEGFYWDLDEGTRAWSKRFFERTGRMPNMSQAGVYSTVTHYLKAVRQAGTDETQAVMKVMRETPVNDFYARGGRIREDGRMVHDMYLFEVKTPAESTGPWDLYKRVATIPGDQAFQPLSASRCPLVKK